MIADEKDHWKGGEVVKICLKNNNFKGLRYLTLKNFFSQEYFEERWIPDPFINSLRDELSEGQEKLAAEKEKRQEATAAKAARKQAALLKSLQGEDDD